MLPGGAIALGIGMGLVPYGIVVSVVELLPAAIGLQRELLRERVLAGVRPATVRG